MSQSAVVQAIANYGPISRASVAKLTGLSKQTISEIVGNLEADGWVRTVGQTEGHIGRRAVVYEIAPDAATVASVDLAGPRFGSHYAILRAAFWPNVSSLPSRPAG